MTKLIPHDPNGNRKPKKPQDGSDPAEHVHYHYYDQRTFHQEGPPGQIDDDNDEEVNEEPEPILAPWQKYALELIGALSILGLLAYVGGTSSTVTTNTVETTGVPLTGTGTPVDQDTPSLAELLASNDARACTHPVTVATLRAAILPSKDNADETSARILSLVRFDLTEATATAIRSDVHEISCEANLRYGDNAGDFQQIEYKLRAAADPSKPPVIILGLDFVDRVMVADLILNRPREIVKSEQPAPPTPADPAPSPTADPVATPDNATNGTTSDDAASAPH